MRNFKYANDTVQPTTHVHAVATATSSGLSGKKAKYPAVYKKINEYGKPMKSAPNWDAAIISCAYCGNGSEVAKNANNITHEMSRILSNLITKT